MTIHRASAPACRMPLAAALALAAATIAGTAPARAELVASPWLDFREAKVRLLADRAPAKDGRLTGAVEIALNPEYKTYWRNAGDSGVPPQFDFTASAGVGAISVAFPFPTRFDDGAGGTAWGYKRSVLLPVSGAREGGAFTLALKLDFAVCGTMCIPLSGTLRLDSHAAAPADAETAARLDKTRAALPVPAETTLPVTVARKGTAEMPKFVVRLPYAGPPDPAGGLAAFPEAHGYLDVTAIEPDGEGHLRLVITGQPEPGSGGRFGPVRLTFGSKTKSFERVIDLDGAAATP